MTSGSLDRSVQLYCSGDLQAALQELAVAEQHARTLGNQSQLVNILVQRAGWLREAGRLDERDESLNRVNELLASLNGSDRDSALVGLQLERGIEAKIASNFSLAEKLLREAEVGARRFSREPELLSDILANLGMVHFATGKFDEAKTALLEAVTIDGERGALRSLTSDLNMIGLLYRASGDHETADRCLAQSRELAEANGFVKEAADALANSAAHLADAGHLDEAQAAFKLVLSAYDKMGRLAEIVSIKSSLAIITLQRGDREGARKLFEEAVKQHQELGEEEFALIDLLNLAQLELDSGQVPSALAQALQARDKAKASGLLYTLWRAQWLLARARAMSLKEVNDPRQKVATLNQVLEDYGDAADTIELLRAGVGRPEQRVQFLWNKEDLYAQAVLFAGVSKNALLAFSFSERSRARAFLDAMGGQRLQRAASGNPLMRRRESITQQILNSGGTGSRPLQQLYDELHLVRSQIAASLPAAAAITEEIGRASCRERV